MVNLIENRNNNAVTTSRIVSDLFCKRIDHVTEKINNLKKIYPNFGDMFYKGYDLDTYGRKEPVWFMNEQGFFDLAGGFSGTLAAVLRNKFFEQFKAMKKRIKELSNPVNQLIKAPKSHILMIAAKAERKAEKNQSKADRYDKTISVPNTYSATIVAKDLGIGACTMNAYLNAWHIIYRQNGSWVLYSRYSGKDYAKYRYYDNVHAKPLLRWTQKGRQFILDQFKEHLNKKFLN